MKETDIEIGFTGYRMMFSVVQFTRYINSIKNTQHVSEGLLHVGLKPATVESFDPVQKLAERHGHDLLSF